MKDHQLVTILLVEDDSGHALLIEKNLRRAHIANDILVLDNGQKAIDFLLHQGEYANNRHIDPLLILLDLNLPGKNGFQVLQIIKADERTKHIPVVVLTTSEIPQEIERCYALGCNVYVTKPVGYDKFTEAIHNLGLFLSVVKVPKRE
jgi:CheY-like chemotaxis protein